MFRDPTKTQNLIPTSSWCIQELFQTWYIAVGIALLQLGVSQVPSDDVGLLFYAVQ